MKAGFSPHTLTCVLRSGSGRLSLEFPNESERHGDSETDAGICAGSTLPCIFFVYSAQVEDRLPRVKFQKTLCLLLSRKAGGSHLTMTLSFSWGKVFGSGDGLLFHAFLLIHLPVRDSDQWLSANKLLWSSHWKKSINTNIDILLLSRCIKLNERVFSNEKRTSTRSPTRPTVSHEMIQPATQQFSVFQSLEERGIFKFLWTADAFYLSAVTHCHLLHKCCVS